MHILFLRTWTDPTEWNVQLDSSLVDLSPSTYDMIAASLPPTPGQQSSSRPPQTPDRISAAVPSSAKAPRTPRTSKATPASPTSLRDRDLGRYTQANRGIGPPNESFVLLQDSVIRNIPSPVPSPTQAQKGSTPKYRQNVATSVIQSPTSGQDEVHQPSPSPLSHHLRSTSRLFNLLSSRTEVDHPLCSECTHILLTNLSRQLEEIKKERDGYIAFEKEVRKEKEREKDNAGKTAEVERKIEKLKEEERFAIEQLKAAEDERTQLEKELKALELEEKTLEEEEAE